MQTPDCRRGWSGGTRSGPVEVLTESGEAALLDWEQQRRVLQALAGSTEVGEPLRSSLQRVLDQLVADGRRTQSVNEFLETTLRSLGEAGAPVEVSLELCLQVEQVRNDPGG